MCKNGHEQAGVVAEETENIIEGSTFRHVKTGVRRYNKEREAREKRIYGSAARFMVLEAFQEILKMQVMSLVKDHGAPEALVGVVRNLWLLYVSQMQNVDRVDDDEMAVQEGVMNLLSQRAPSHNQASTMLADALFSQHTQSQRYEPVDDSLDIMLRRVDDDIARDEAEMLEWDRELQLSDNDEPGAMSPNRHDNNGDDEGSDEGRDNIFNDTNGKQAARARTGSCRPGAHKRSLDQIEKYPKMEYLPVFLYLGYRFLRLPVLSADIFRMLVEERIPYLSAHDRLPERIHECVGYGYSVFFRPLFPPSVVRILYLSNAFGRFFASHYSIEPPLPDVPSMLLSLLKRLGLGIELYTMVMRLLELTSTRPCQPTWNVSWPERVLISAIIVVLKMHYGLDEIERQSPPGALPHAPNLPSLHDFLDKWRSDWESELSIGTLPHITAFGDEWEAAFVENCRRAMVRRKGSTMVKSFKEIATKYRRMIESVVSSGGMSAEEAQRILPPEYAKHFSANEPALTRTQIQSSSQIADSVATSTRNASSSVQPIAHYKVNSVGTKRPLYTLLEPFYHHPEIQLEPGEHYFSTLHYINKNATPGYTVPIVGLIYARCA
ncbi:hypothetical protein GGI21_003848, partial [Coemansia aciculifera]